LKVVFLDAITLGSDISLDKFREFGEVVIYQKTSPNQTLERVKDANIVVTNKVVIDKNIMLSCSNLELVCIAATGMNNVDLDAAKEQNIAVKNVAGYSTPSVTQHTFAMLFYLLEKLKYYDNTTKSGAWSKSGIFTDISHPYSEIAGKNWGIIGLGTIGKEVAKVASSFGCNISYYSTSGKNSNANYKECSLDELLKSSDIISIHAPLNEQTNNLLDSSKLALLKDGTILLNLGRGGIVNEKDLAKALDNQDIYAALDVTSKEPIELENPLLHIKNRDRLLITPHIAWASKESRERLVEGIFSNIKDYLKC
jgi:glycerate dehydrogenase